MMTQNRNDWFFQRFGWSEDAPSHVIGTRGLVAMTAFTIFFITIILAMFL